MTITTTHTPTPAQKQSIYHLWNNEYPAQLAYADITGIDQYLLNLNNQRHYFVADNDNVVGWAFTFEREAEKWFAIIVDSTTQRKGVGTMLMDALKEQEPILNGWVTDHDRYKLLNGAPYPSPLSFYLKNGFEVCGDVRLETDKLSAIKIRWGR